MAQLSAKEIIETINEGIALNPTEITFTQKTKTIVDGAFQEQETVNTIRVLIYMDDSQGNVNIISGTHGTSYSNKKYNMIADKDANLEVSPKESIEFESHRCKYKITYVYPQIIENTLCGYICDLERID